MFRWIAQGYEQFVKFCSRRKATAVLLQSNLEEPECFFDWPTFNDGSIAVPAIRVGHDMEQLEAGLKMAAKSRLVALFVHKKWLIDGVEGDEDAAMAATLETAKAAVSSTGARLVAVVTMFAATEYPEWTSAILRKHGVTEMTHRQFYEELQRMSMPVRPRETARNCAWSRMLAEVRVLCSLL